jgi:hypothetical protein
MQEVIRTTDIFLPDGAAIERMVLRRLPRNYAHRWQLGANGATYFKTFEEVADFLRRYGNITWFRPCRVTHYGIREEYHITLAKRERDVPAETYDNLVYPKLRGMAQLHL